MFSLVIIYLLLGTTVQSIDSDCFIKGAYFFKEDNIGRNKCYRNMLLSADLTFELQDSSFDEF